MDTQRNEPGQQGGQQQDRDRQERERQERERQQRERERAGGGQQGVRGHEGAGRQQEKR